ncbi:class I glutamine amidotransferase-like protein [Emericellopsis atlantica]|uniref:Class I glutamine amidotransferase-like protein n=1 Tax=Emericellopsis atlantica TaxID=2614577 RepID=A0A9P8CTD0_9HYPO|nr:class I glutamine amidotransferase-like protein [Emericellopsis atlantica]KAG9258120.1 class I glutamine amidotransferase-like protein [Emericellopsis atlantica]
MRKFRLAVLECDTPIEPVVEKLGTYAKIFDTFVRRGLEGYIEDGGAMGVDLEVTSHQMVDMEELPSFKEVDCLMLTGSKHNAFEDHPWITRLVDYCRLAYETTDIPLVGICFGHQIIARALGAKVQRNAGVWEVAVDQVDLTPEGQKLFNSDKLFLHQMHQDIVATLPEGSVLLGKSPKCEIQGFYIPKRVLTLQAHPEFSEFIMDQVMRRRFEQKIFTPEVYESGISRASKEHDGLKVSKVIWKFLLEDL